MTEQKTNKCSDSDIDNDKHMFYTYWCQIKYKTYPNHTNGVGAPLIGQVFIHKRRIALEIILHNFFNIVKQFNFQAILQRF